MATMSNQQKMVRAAALIMVVMVLNVFLLPADADDASEARRWGRAHATFYGGKDGQGTMGGACGYGNLWDTGYGLSTAALSYPLFNNGATCGACFQLTCDRTGTRWCYDNGKSITVTATNSCPGGSTGGWCDPPRQHFDLSWLMFTTLAQEEGGVIPVYFRRVACYKTGGMRFTISGNPNFLMVLVHNVAGAGDVQRLLIKSSQTGWRELKRNWGQVWQYTWGPDNMVGQRLSFRTITSDRRQLVSYNVAPADWKFGQTFEGRNYAWNLKEQTFNRQYPTDVSHL